MKKSPSFGNAHEYQNVRISLVSFFAFLPESWNVSFAAAGLLAYRFRFSFPFQHLGTVDCS
jgi:hypothetical protein